MGCLKTHIEWEPNLRLVYSNWASNMFQGVDGASSGGGSSSGNNGGITNGFAAIVGLHSDANGNIISNGSYEGIGNGFLSDGTNFVDLFDGEVYDLNPVDIGVVKNRFTGFSDGQTSAIHNSAIGQLSGSNDASYALTSGIALAADLTELTANVRSYIHVGSDYRSVTKALANKQYYHNGSKYWQGNYAKAPVKDIAKYTSKLKYLKGFGKAAGVAGQLVSLYQVGDEFSNERYKAGGARLFVAGLAAGAVFIPGVGWGVAIGIGVIDAVWGDDFYNWLEQ